jgi:beta-barrel assembly-enhancing protease
MRPSDRTALPTRVIAALAMAAFLACSTAALAQDEMSLPQLGEPAGAILGKNDEYEYGLMTERMERAEGQILEDPETQEYIESLGTRLAAQSQMGGADFHYYVINQSEINAFSTPYFIFCNYGTILAMQNESELAAILAHETAHATQHHIARELMAQSHRTLAAAAEMLAAVLIGAVGGGAPAIEGGIAAAQGLAAADQLSFSRSVEEEADRIGMQYLYKAGFDPEAMPDAFELLEQRYGYEEGLIPAFLQDHPVTSDRIAYSRARAALLPHPANVTSSIDFLLIRARLRALTASQDFDIIGYFRKRLESGAATVDDATLADVTLADEYGLALAYLEREQPKKAVEILKPLVAKHQSVTLLLTALGQAEIAAGEDRSGIATFAQGETLFPRNVPLTVRYAQALIKVGNPKLANDLLNDLFNIFAPTPSQIQLIARAADDAGDKGDAFDYMGEYYISNGNLPLASIQLERALRTPNLTDVQRKRFAARLLQVRDAITEVRRESGHQ